MGSPTETPTIIMVQGSFQLPDAYYKLDDALRALGYPVVHPLLPSLTDEEKPGFATKSLTDDALAIRSEVQRLVEQGKKVFVVMHSYGGLVGTEAVTKDLSFDERQPAGLPGGVVHLFYFAAFILPTGQSVLDVFGESPNNDVKPDGRFTIKNAANILYHDLPDAEAQEWESKIINQSYAVQKTKMTNEAFGFVKSTYVVCENDRGPPPMYQEKFGEMAGSKIQKISSGHSPMLSHTAELTRMIDQVVKSVIETGAQV
ncbi:catalytic protein [Annulohypoxylon truncatum]|uniref:catalytic protein n=1 Tax=Annulohypoxylon truncatum TaxID=327061 RepID=UPI00200826AC|nr:catalytic protein [Annulohypoxylon truncatum]KAI1213247.1 catalytic protein [Annulohypoxylon truncatum]